MIICFREYLAEVGYLQLKTEADVEDFKRKWQEMVNSWPQGTVVSGTPEYKIEWAAYEPTSGILQCWEYEGNGIWKEV